MEHPEIVDEDDDVVEKKMTDDDKKDDNDDHTDHALVRSEVSGSLETRNEHIQTPIPLPPRSSRTNLSSDKDTWAEESVIDEDKVIPEDETPEMIKEFQNINKHVRIEFKTFNEEAQLSNIGKIHGIREGTSTTKEESKIIQRNTSPITGLQKLVNLTAPTLTFLGIKAHDPYSIVDKLNTGLIYLNIKEEKRVMYLAEIVKFCDATLDRVLKEIKLKIFEIEFLKKTPLLGELDPDIMKAYEREILKHLQHRKKMRRWESFMNGRPILPTMKR
ncbi:hypothetical protein Tco_0088550 [Tanacetum coccineum]